MKCTDEAFDVMWMQVKTCASANGIPICESAKRPVHLASTLASSVGHIWDRTRSEP